MTAEPEFDAEAWAREKIAEGENPAIVVLVKLAVQGEIQICDAVVGGIAIVQNQQQQKRKHKD